MKLLTRLSTYNSATNSFLATGISAAESPTKKDSLPVPTRVGTIARGVELGSGGTVVGNAPSWRRTWLLAGFLWFAVSFPLGAVHEPEHPRLPNLDARIAAKPVTVGQSNAVVNLRARLPQAAVQFDLLTGSPKLILARDGFLSGKNGLGRGVSAAAVRAFAPGDPLLPTKAFLQEHRGLFGHGPEALGAARITRDYVAKHNRLHTVIWQQQVDGIPVHEGVLMAHTTAKGELVNLASRFLADPVRAANNGTSNRAALLANPGITPRQAIALAAAAVGETVTATAVMAVEARSSGAEKYQRFRHPRLPGETHARLVWLPLNGTTLRLCWDIVLTSKQRGEMFRLLVDAASGKVHVRQGLTEYISDATYRVYTSDSPTPFSPSHPTPQTNLPPLVARSLVTLKALNLTASPKGWVYDGLNETLGNNVDAHLDINSDDQPDLPRPQGSPFRVFDFPLDLTKPPSAYQDAAVAQLFYWCNFMHDKLYELGFTEAAGNFQTENFNRGGVGNDALQADAQDGGGVNNANMSTPPDGLAPRMQMYVFDHPAPGRDGDLDAEVIIHEYAHGLSNRRVGGGVGISALQTAGMGEGWSDFYALALLSQSGDNVNGNYAIGGYVLQDYYAGIRRFPYSTDRTINPLTLRDIDPSSGSTNASGQVHNQGEVWCVILWEARANLISKYGWAVGNQLILQLVTDGMELCPVNPNFIQARDGILQADLINSGGANQSELWAAFAKRGMGINAVTPESYTTFGVVESFDPADALRIQPDLSFVTSGGSGGPFQPVSQSYTLSNAGPSSLSWTAAKTQPWVSVSASSGALAPGEVITVTISLSDTAATLSSGSYSDTVTFTDLSSGISLTRAVRLTIKPSLTQALDDPNRTWITGGSAPWTGQFVTTHDGLDAAESGAISDREESWMETTVTGPGALSFWWKVSSESNFDNLRFYVNGSQQGVGISGETDWQQWTVDLPSGSQTLRWQYSKDNFSSGGLDRAWVDQVLLSQAPSVNTGEATLMGSSAATFNGLVNSHGLVTAVMFEYGLTTNYGNSVTAIPSPVFDSASVAVSAAVNGLTAGVTYHYRITAANSEGSSVGADAFFVLPVDLAAALDLPGLIWNTGGGAPWMVQTNVTVDGGYAAQSGAIGVGEESWMETTIMGPGVLSYWWKVSSESGFDYLEIYLNGVLQNGRISGEVDWQLQRLELPAGPETVRWRYVKDGAVSGGSDSAWVDQITFIPMPYVFTGPASPITSTEATLNGFVNANGKSTVVTFEYGEFPGLDNIVTAVPSPVVGSDTTSVSAVIRGLRPDTYYAYRLKGVNRNGAGTGSYQIFVTPAPGPIVTTDSATAVTASGATLNGMANANGKPTAVTFDYGLTIDYGSTVTAEPSTATGLTNTSVSAIVTGLMPGRTYHYRIRGVNEDATNTGADATLTVGVELAEALDTPGRTWTTGGDLPWVGQVAVTLDGVDAGQSGTIQSGQESWMETTVTGPGLLSFWSKVPAEFGFDSLEFSVNGGLQSVSFGGASDWRYQSLRLPAGNQTLRWRYVKDPGFTSNPSSAWVDLVSFSPDIQLVWGAISSPQVVGVPFAVTISAATPDGLATNFTGPVSLSGLIAGEGTNNTLLGGVSQPESENSGTFTLGYSFTPNADLVVTHVRHYAGTKVSLWTDGGTLLAAREVDSVPGTWVETPLATPIPLTAGATYRVGVRTGGATYYYRFDLTASFPDGTIGQSYHAFGDGFPENSNGLRWPFVDLRYTVGTSPPVAISPMVSGNFVNGVWTGNVTVLAAATNLSLLADDGSGHAGNSSPFSVINARVPQVITFSPVRDRVQGEASFELLATASSGLPGSYTVTAGVATVTGSVVSVTGPGTVTIRATQAGNGSYLAAPAVERSFSVVNPAVQLAGTLSGPRYGHTATRLLDGTLMVVGGTNGSAALATAEWFNPSAGVWVAKGSMATGRYRHSATLLANGKVLVVGGTTTGASLATAELYDPAIGRWSATAGLSAARQNHEAVRLPDGRVLVMGGRGAAGVLPTTEIYDPVAGSWRPGLNMITARERFPATLLGDGTVLVAGGNGAGGVPLAGAETYSSVMGIWSAAGSLAGARFGHTGTLLPDGRVLVAGGMGSAAGTALATAELYQPATRTWAVTGSLMTARHSHFAVSLLDGRVLAGGGFNGAVIQSLEMFDAASGRWTVAGYLNAARRYATANLLDDRRVLIAGGLTATGATQSTEFFLPVIGAFVWDGSLSLARYAHTETLLADGRVLVAGGVGKGPVIQSSSETSDAEGGVWTRRGDMIQRRFGHAAALLGNGQVLVVGGKDVGSLASAELFDPAGGMWFTTGSLRTPRRYLTATTLIDGRVLVVGGVDPSGRYPAGAELYDPITQVWSDGPSLAAGRFYHTATKLADGRVLVVGGIGTAGRLRSAELFHPVTGAWTTVGSTSVGHERHTATLLADGRVLVAGGFGDAGALTTAELFNPATGTWSVIGRLRMARGAHTATMLGSGRVLVTGGSGGDGITLSSLVTAEVFNPISASWGLTGALGTARHNHRAALLNNGRVLVTGGIQTPANNTLSTTELYFKP